jgi:hypothetical protein
VGALWGGLSTPQKPAACMPTACWGLWQQLGFYPHTQSQKAVQKRSKSGQRLLATAALRRLRRCCRRRSRCRRRQSSAAGSWRRKPQRWKDARGSWQQRQVGNTWTAPPEVLEAHAALQHCSAATEAAHSPLNLEEAGGLVVTGLVAVGMYVHGAPSQQLQAHVKVTSSQGVHGICQRVVGLPSPPRGVRGCRP